MAVYRFRVCFEDHEDIYRDIDLRADQNFHELSKIILASIGFDQNHGFTWFKSDDFWRKGKELAAGFGSAAATNTGPYVDIILRKTISDPHQKFLFIYDQNEEWTFLVELVKVGKEEAGKSYPMIVKQTGIAPKQYKIVLPPGGLSDDEDEPRRKKVSKPAAKPELVNKAVPPLVEDDEPDDDEIDDDQEADDDEMSSAVAIDDTESFDEEELSGLEGEEGEDVSEEEDEFGNFEDSSGAYDDGEERY